MALTIGFLVIGGSLSRGSQHDWERSPFATVPRPVALAANTERLLTASIGLTCEAGILSFDSAGRAAPFVVVPNSGSDCDRGADLALSPYTAFGKGFVYLLRNNVIHKIDPETRVVTDTPFATIDRAGAITFDNVGTFGKSLLVATDAGSIYALSPDGDGADQPIATEAVGHEAVLGDLDVAPRTFGRYGGCLLVGSEIPPVSGRFALYAVRPPSQNGCPLSGGSSVQPVPESQREDLERLADIKFIPKTSCAFGTSGGSLFSVDASYDRVNIYRGASVPHEDAAVLFGSNNKQVQAGLWEHSEFRMVPENDGLRINPYLVERSQELPVISEAAFVPCPTEVSVDDVSVEEGDEGAKNVAFDLQLAIANQEPVRVDYRTADPPASMAPATRALDYTPVKDYAVFSPGETRKTVEVPVVGDTLPEPDEKFLLTVGEPCIVAPDSPGVACALGDTVTADGVGTILNDDELGLALPDLAPPKVELPGLKLAPDPVSPKQPPVPPATQGPTSTDSVSGTASSAFGQVSQPPPAPPSGAPVPSPGGAPGSLSVPAGAPAPGNVSVPAGSTAPGGLQAPVPAAAPPVVAVGQGVPVAVPGAQAQREEEPEAAPEADYAMVGRPEDAVPASLLLAGAVLMLLCVPGGTVLLSGTAPRRPAYSIAGGCSRIRRVLG